VSGRDFKNRIRDSIFEGNQLSSESFVVILISRSIYEHRAALFTAVAGKSLFSLTHTHVRFCEKWGHPISIMVFILYKLCVLLPYT